MSVSRPSFLGVPGTEEGVPEFVLDSGGVKRCRPNLSVVRLPPLGVGNGLSGVLLAESGRVSDWVLRSRVLLASTRDLEAV